MKNLDTFPEVVASTIVCHTIFPWATFRQPQGGGDGQSASKTPDSVAVLGTAVAHVKGDMRAYDEEGAKIGDFVPLRLVGCDAGMPIDLF